MPTASEVSPRNILVAGATGEIGKRVTSLLSNDKSIKQLHVLTRQTSSVLDDARIDKTRLCTHTVDFDQIETSLPDMHLDTFICTLGTTIKTAGSQKQFYRVDHDYVLASAKAARQRGANRCIVVSSVGASSNSSSFYLKTKGEMEEGLSKLGFDCCYFIRPSLLIGDRKAFRLGEKLGGLFSYAINPFLLGSLSRYKSIHMNVVAKAIVSTALVSSDASSKLNIYENSDICRLASQHDAGIHLNSI